MNLRIFFLAAIISLASVQATLTTVNHDRVQSFAQPKPVTDSEKAAVKYKRTLYVSSGCHSYPAVQANGSASGGLRWSGPADGDCKGPNLGSQVDARSAWHEDVWAIMYAWYFPKAADLKTRAVSGRRHYWEYAIVWIDDPSLDNPTLLGVSISTGIGFQKKTPPKSKYLDGSAVKLDSYYGFWGDRMALRLTTRDGESQDLITWEQLTDEARDALNTAEDNDSAWEYTTLKSPLMDENFTEKLEKAWPF